MPSQPSSQTSSQLHSRTSSQADAEPLSPVKQALLEIRRLRGQLAVFESAESARNEPVAIVGMAVRMPGGISTLDAFWEALEDGRNCVGEVPSERWNMEDFYAADPTAAGKISSRYGAFLSDVDQFDAEFFGISPREAERMDPQQRLLLEVAWEALEDAGIAPPELAGSQAGVYLGLSNSDYGRMLLNDAKAMDPHTVAGGALSIAAGRLSYFFNLRGPSMVVDTACSSSLVALHLACASLRAGETNLAIVGGANLMLLPEGSVGFSRSRMLAPDGRCKTFDRNADGYVRGEGCVAIVVMRLSDAQRSGHRIHALYRGSAVNQDGRSAGLTAPNGPSQEKVLHAALAAAGVASQAVSYVECHGTGTALGDPIEVQALAGVFTQGRDPGNPLRIGSVKANIGHIEAAAALAGLVKTVLALERSVLPGQINLDRLNPYIAWDTMPISVVRSKMDWRRGVEPRIAGVSSFGFSGTNAHVVIEEAPAEPPASRVAERETHLFCLSAKTSGALREVAERYVSWFGTTVHTLCDICFTANAGRAHHRERLSFLVTDVRDLRSRLRNWLDDGLSRQDEPTAAFEPEQDGSNGADTWKRSMQRLQQAYLNGEKVDWTQVYQDRVYRRVSLPLYPFQRKSYWMTPIYRTSVAAREVATADSIDLAAADDATLDETPLSAAILALPQQARAEWVGEYVTGCIRRCLGLEAAHPLESRDRLTDLGMDSLIALELRATISRELGLGDRIASTIAFDAGTVEELVRIVLEATFAPATQEAPEEVLRAPIESHRFTADELTGLSEEQVEHLIAGSIGQLAQGSAGE